MKNFVIASSLLAVSFSTAQAQIADGVSELQVPLSAVECEVDDNVPPGAFDSDLWAARLVEGDLDLRMAAYEAIVEAGSRDQGVFHCLQEWAGDPTEDGLAWTARMALREIERMPAEQEDPWGFGTGDLDWVGDSPLGSSGVSPFEIERNLQHKFDRLHRQMQQGFAPGAVPGNGVEQRSFSVEFGPNGMKVRTRRFGVEGENESQWEAQSIEDLFKAHPELESELPGLGGLRLRFGVPRESGEVLAPPADEGPRTDVLGVECRPLALGDAERLGLSESAQGVLVVRTVPGTIADELGVRRGDILTRLNGAPLTTPAHISQALARREPEDAIQLRLFDAHGQGRSLVWSPRGPGDEVWEAEGR